MQAMERRGLPGPDTSLDQQLAAAALHDALVLELGEQASDGLAMGVDPVGDRDVLRSGVRRATVG